MKDSSLTRFVPMFELLYLLLIALSFYLLYSSRTGEARTVWEVLHPAFLPTLFAATSLLVTIILTSEKAAYKLLFIIVHSVLVHSLFSMIFPVGDLSGQQMVLGRTRLVYDNAILHGWPPWPAETIQTQLYQWFRGENFQTALSIVFARMFSVDLLWIHLSLVPVLWGVFTPIAAYLITNTLTQNDKTPILASLLISAFPYATYFGAISVPNSLGFIFFFYSLYFMLKRFSSNDSKTTILMVAFSSLAFLAHYLTGIMSFALLLLAAAFKSHKSEKVASASAKFSLVISFIVSASILPLSLIYLRFFRPETMTAFTLDKLHEMPIEEIVGLSFLGELMYGFNLKTILLVVVGPVLALVYMIYLLFKSKRNPTNYRTHICFLFAVFLIMLIDYRILKLFMEGLPLNEERLWVLRDFVAAPFVASGIYAVISWLKSCQRGRSPRTTTVLGTRPLSKYSAFRVLSLFLALNVLIPVLLGGWMTLSLSAAYPQVAPLQITWYELEAVKYIKENTKEKYVVIGDIWTIFAGEVIVGINNPRAYYFLEYNRTGYDLFVNMKQEPSPQWMLYAMNLTDTRVAYFIVTEPRLGIDEFNNVVSKARNTLTVFYVAGAGKLYVFSYEKSVGL